MMPQINLYRSNCKLEKNIKYDPKTAQKSESRINTLIFSYFFFSKFLFTYI